MGILDYRAQSDKLFLDSLEEKKLAEKRFDNFLSADYSTSANAATDYTSGRSNELHGDQLISITASASARSAGSLHLTEIFGGVKGIGNSAWPRISAPLPETFNIIRDNDIQQTFSFLKLVGDIPHVLQVTPGVFGGDVYGFDKGLSERQFWRSPGNPEMTFEILFEAHRDCFQEVVAPIQRLLQYASPTSASVTGNIKSYVTGDAGDTESLLKNFDAYWRSPPRVAVSFGKLLTLDECWLKTVSPTWSSKLDENFLPMSASVSITIIQMNPPGAEEVGKWFSRANTISS